MDRLILRCVIGADRGHFELSSQAALKASWSSAAVKIVAEGSRDPDAFEWGNPAAHGQADIGNNGILSRQAEADAVLKFKQWIADLSKKVLSSCACNRPADAAYFTGYLLHAVQDLATHEGITNAEHSYLSSYQTNPDADGARLDRAAEWSGLVLATLGKKMPGSCSTALRSLTDAQVTVRTAFGPKDGDAGELFAFWRLAGRYKDALGTKPPALAPWFNAGTATGFFRENVVKPIEATPTQSCAPAP